MDYASRLSFCPWEWIFWRQWRFLYFSHKNTQTQLIYKITFFINIKVSCIPAVVKAWKVYNMRIFILNLEKWIPLHNTNSSRLNKIADFITYLTCISCGLTQLLCFIHFCIFPNTVIYLTSIGCYEFHGNRPENCVVLYFLILSLICFIMTVIVC